MEDKQYLTYDMDQMYRIFDKTVKVLSEGTKLKKWDIHKNSTDVGMDLYFCNYGVSKYFIEERAVMIFRVNLDEEYVNVKFKNRDCGLFYGKNSLSCKNLIDQIEIEHQKIVQMLDEFFEELENTIEEIPVVEEKDLEKDEPHKPVAWWKFWK